jgi:cytochrome c-type biogenesis protein CcmH
VNIVYLLAIVGILFVAGAVLWHIGNSSEAKAARGRRKLLLDRAEGRVFGEEFEARQAALDSILIDKNLGGSSWPIVAAVIGAGVVTAAVFAWLNSRASVDQAQSELPGVAAPLPGGQPQQKQGGDLRNLAKPLAQKLAANPNDGPGWLLLARTYAELHQFAEAEVAFEKASKLMTQDAPMLVGWAEANVAANNRQWSPVARDILMRALVLDSHNLKGLTLAVSEAVSRNDTRQAAAYRQQIAMLATSGEAKSNGSVLVPEDKRSGTSTAKLPALPARNGS